MPTVQWLKDGQQTSSAYDLLTNPGYGRLIIKDSNRDDNGSYRCRFTNIKASILSSAAIVTIIGKILSYFFINNILSYKITLYVHIPYINHF